MQWDLISINFFTNNEATISLIKKPIQGAPQVTPRATVNRSGQHRRSDRGQEGQQQTNKLIDFLSTKKVNKAFTFAPWQTFTPKKCAATT
jgi:hypothetical protein